MKVCPSCNAQYADETLSFCLHDGTPLAQGAQADTPTVVLGETETFVARSGYSTPPSEVTRVQTFEQPAPRSNTALAVALTAVGMLLLFIVVGGGAWLLTRGTDQAAANANSNANTQPTRLDSNLNSATPVTNTYVPPSPLATASVPSANTNSNTPARPPDIDDGTSRNEVSQRVYGWRSLMESRDLGSYMDNYAPTLDRYYTKSGVSASTVRADKARAFARYSSMRVNISNMDVSVNGESATATFDKEWNFSGTGSSSGKVRSQLSFRRINGRWLITGERDVRVYYTR